MFKFKIEERKVENPRVGDIFICVGDQYLIKEVDLKKRQLLIENITDSNPNPTGPFTYPLGSWKNNVRIGEYKLLKASFDV